MACGQDAQLGGSQVVADHDGELVAAQAGDDPGLADAGAQAAGGLDQQGVADRVAQAVVDALEVVQVQAAGRRSRRCGPWRPRRRSGPAGTTGGWAVRSARRSGPGADALWSLRAWVTSAPTPRKPAKVPSASWIGLPLSAHQCRSSPTSTDTTTSRNAFWSTSRLVRFEGPRRLGQFRAQVADPHADQLLAGASGRLGHALGDVGRGRGRRLPQPVAEPSSKSLSSRLTTCFWRSSSSPATRRSTKTLACDRHDRPTTR